MTRRPDQPAPRCPYCEDWTTVRDPDHPRQFVPCPFCQADSPLSSHQRSLAALIQTHRTGRTLR